jgi:hypothetical protein
MSVPKFISNEEFLARAKIVTEKADYLGRNTISSSDKYANKGGGALYIGPMETKNDVQKFFDNLKACGVIVECEDNIAQKNYAPTIRLTFTKPKAMLAAISWVFTKKPDEMHFIDEKTCCFWWD